jgi:hypothetical protein
VYTGNCQCGEFQGNPVAALDVFTIESPAPYPVVTTINRSLELYRFVGTPAGTVQVP